MSLSNSESRKARFPQSANSDWPTTNQQKKAYELLVAVQRESDNSLVFYMCLQEVLEVFGPLHSAQTLLKADQCDNTTSVRENQRTAWSLQLGVFPFQTDECRPPHELTQALAQNTL